MKSNFANTTQNGFSIIELMVVVSIIGILATVAVPAYCKYSAQAKQAQAKISLGAIYTAESSFVIGNGSYTACLGDIGINSSSQGPVAYYAIGFNPGIVLTTGCGPAGNKTCFAQSFGATPTPCTSNGDGDVSFPASVNMSTQNTTIPAGAQLFPHSTPVPPSYVSNHTFFAMAVGNISSCNSSYDRWTIDQTKRLGNDAPAL